MCENVCNVGLHLEALSFDFFCLLTTFLHFELLKFLP